MPGGAWISIDEAFKLRHKPRMLEPHPLIRAKESEIERRRRELELMEAELRGMRAMLAPPADSRDAPVVQTLQTALATGGVAAATEPRRGRQPGAISHQWRDTLAMLWMNYPYPQGFTEYNAATAAQAAGLPNVRPADALERMTAYMNHGYVERLPDGKWRVTDLTANKYRFSDKGAPPGSAAGPP
jgi:hypothetical protein